MVQMKLPIWLSVFLWRLLDHGSSGVDTVEVSVLEGDSVTLNTGVQTSQQDDIRWYYKDDRIAKIYRDKITICTDVQCEEGLRDRLKLDHQTGSLTIINITNTHSRVYTLKIGSGSDAIEKIFIVSVTDSGGLPSSVQESGLSSAAVGRKCVVAVTVILLVTAVIYCYWRSKQTRNRRPRDDHPQENDVPEAVALNP